MHNKCKEILDKLQMEHSITISSYTFPPKQELKLRLKDMLEDEVDEKYYLSNETIEKLKSYGYEQSLRINDTESTCETINTMGGGHREPKIIQYDIPQQVKVRKNNVDIDKLKQTLRKSKNYSNREISLILNKPLTLVEHWFRNDNCFSIPDADIWLKLKELLNITNDEFDKPIMEFEKKEGIFEKANRIYDEKGISPTITSTTADEKIMVREATKKGFKEAYNGDSVNLAYPESETRRGRVGEQVAQILQCNDSMGVVDSYVSKKYSDFEKENGYIPELFNPYNQKEITDIAPTQSTQCGSTTSSATVLYSEYSKKKIEQNINAINSELSGTLTANCMQSINHDNCQMTFTNNLRIRKLTPKECWRLMGFDDEDFEKASQVNSNAQLYKQAGNSICVPVLEEILKNLLVLN